MKNYRYVLLTVIVIVIAAITVLDFSMAAKTPAGGSISITVKYKGAAPRYHRIKSLKIRVCAAMKSKMKPFWWVAATASKIQWLI